VTLGSFRSCSSNGLHGGEDKLSDASHSYQFKHLLPLGKRPCVQFLARPHDVRARPLQAFRYQKRSRCHCHHRRIARWAERQALADVQRSSPLPKPPLRKSTTRYAASCFGTFIRTEHVREAPARWEDHVETTAMHCMQQKGLGTTAILAQGAVQHLGRRGFCPHFADAETALCRRGDALLWGPWVGEVAADGGRRAPLPPSEFSEVAGRPGFEPRRQNCCPSTAALQSTGNARPSPIAACRFYVYRLASRQPIEQVREAVRGVVR
jgi:hypothetical protein